MLNASMAAAEAQNDVANTATLQTEINADNDPPDRMDSAMQELQQQGRLIGGPVSFVA
jgi:hypothetical protein